MKQQVNALAAVDMKPALQRTSVHISAWVCVRWRDARPRPDNAIASFCPARKCPCQMSVARRYFSIECQTGAALGACRNKAVNEGNIRRVRLRDGVMVCVKTFDKLSESAVALSACNHAEISE